MVISTRERLREITGDNCFISNLISVSGYFSLAMRESWFYSSIGYQNRFGYWVSRNGSERTPCLQCFDADVERKGLDKILSQAGMTLEQHMYDTTDEFMEFIKTSLKSDMPVIVNVNSLHMNYWPENIIDSYAHYIIVYGISEDGFVNVIDNYIPSTPVQSYNGLLSMEAFIKALDFTGVRINHGKKIAWTLHPADSKCLRFPSASEVFKNYIINTVNNFEEASTDNRIDIGKNCFIYSTGTKALEAFKTFMNTEMTRQNSEKDILVELYKNITSFGGPICMLGLIQKFLEDYSQESSVQEDLVTLKNNITDLTTYWRSMGINLFRYSMFDSMQYLDKALNFLEMLISKETENIACMKNILCTTG